MNGKSRHNKYRKSVYRRRNVSAILIIAVICIGVSVTAFLVIGNLLKNQSDKRHESDTQDTEISLDSQSTDDKASIKNILAHPVLLETKESGNFASRLDALTEKNVYEASVPLNTPDGALLFKSLVADKIDLPSGEANVTLENAVSAATTRTVYLSGIFYVNAFKEENALVRAVELSRAAAIVAEALNTGFDDVVLIAPHISETHIEEAIRFTEDIKSLTDNGTIGLCLSDNILSMEDTQQLSQMVDHLNDNVDFLAVNLSDTDISAGVDAISEAISAKQHYILMYKMRVILPQGETDDILLSIITEAQNNGIKNIQIMP